MKLIRQQEHWTCGIAAMAMLLDECPSRLMMELGHSGNKILWPSLPEPSCFRGFHTQEFVDMCFDRGFALMTIEAMPYSSSSEHLPAVPVFNLEQANTRISRYIDGHPGIIIGEVESGNRHAVAWDGLQVYDPRGHVYDFGSSQPTYSEGNKSFYPVSISEFLMLIKIKSK